MITWLIFSWSKVAQKFVINWWKITSLIVASFCQKQFVKIEHQFQLIELAAPLAPSQGTKKRRRKPWKTSFLFPRPPQSEYASPLVHVRSDTKDCCYISRWFYSTGQTDKPAPAFSATSVTHQSPPRKCGQHLVVSLDAIDKVQCHNTANKTLCAPSSIIRRNRCRRRRFHIPWR